MDDSLLQVVKRSAQALLTSAHGTRVRDALILGGLLALGIFVWHSASGAFGCFSNAGDEGMEVNKALLVASGHQLYSEIWNDQPPLYTLFLKTCVKSGMVEMEWFRRATFGFTVLLLFALCGLGAMLELSITELLFAGGFLTTSFAFLPTSASTTLEFPALALGMLGAWVMLVAIGRSSIVLGVLAGLLFGIGAMVKLTALSVFPVVGGFVVVGVLACRWRCVLVCAVTLLTVVTIAIGVWWVCTDGASWRYLFVTHLSHYSVVDPEAGTMLRFHWTWFSSQLLLTVAVVAGEMSLARSSRKWTAVLLGVWGAAIVLVFAGHFPWWPYYSVHLSIPLAYLAGIGLCRAIGLIFDGRDAGVARTCLKLAVAVFAVVSIWNWAEVFSAEAARVRAVGPWQDNPIVRCVRDRVTAAGKHRQTMLQLVSGPYAVYCRLDPLPWYAVLPLKRRWIGALTDEELATQIRAQKAEVLFAPALEMAPPELAEAMQARYQQVCTSEDVSVWLPRNE